MLWAHSAVSTDNVYMVSWTDKTFDKGRGNKMKLSKIQQTTARQKAIYFNGIVCRGGKDLSGGRRIVSCI